MSANPGNWDRFNLFRVSTTLLLLNPLLLLFVKALTAAFSLTSITLILLCLTSILSIGNPVWVAITVALEDFTFLNYFLINPVHTFRIENSDDVVTLMVFLFASISVSLLLKTLANRKDEIGLLLAKFDQLGRRHEKSAPSQIYLMGAWLIDIGHRTIARDGESGSDLHLTPTEWKLLEILVKNEGGLVSHEQILKYAWGQQYSAETNYLRLYLSQLRKKFEVNPKKPVLLITEQGVGYRAIAKRVEQQ
jgi:DNA-binding winged helix-turn-helix (wHTH) protein